MKKTSPWFDSVSDERRYPPLEGSMSADVAVIGGGMVGVMAAWKLAEKGLSVVLLEKNRIASGDTGFTTAFLTRVPDVSLADLEKRYGSKFVVDVCAAAASAQRTVIDLIAREGIECGFAECRSYHCTYDAGNAFLAAEWLAARRSDARAQKIGAEALRSDGAPGAEAVRREGEARFDVRKFLIGLLQRPTGRKIRVFEESEVTEISVGPYVKLRTAKSEITARKLIVATGLPHRAFPELHPLFDHKITYALAARYHAEAPIPDDLFWDTDEPYQYFRRLDERTVILGGADRGAKESLPPGASPHAPLEVFARRVLPGAIETTHQWSGSLFYTEDGLPYASEHPFYRGKIFVAAGFGGNGMVMGAMAGLLTAELAAGGSPAGAELFSFARTGAVIARPTKITPPAPSLAKRGKPEFSSPLLKRRLGGVARWILPLAYLFFLSLPGIFFFKDRGGTGFLAGLDARTFSLLIFPLAGLYAFFFVWMQILIGTNMDLLRRIYRRIEMFHRAEGLFALLLAITHPSLILFGFGLSGYLSLGFVAPRMKIFALIGEVQLFLMLLTVSTALLMRHPWLKRRWHVIHYLNYLVFTLVWVHSWFLGTDVRPTALRYLWMFYGLTAAVSTAGRIVRARAKRTVGGEAPKAPGNWQRLTAAASVQEGVPFCADVGGRAIAVFNLGTAYYAMDNVCSHAGGPLCQGSIGGDAIECPWHGSKFDIKTGAVVGPPAQIPQATYSVRVNGPDLEIQL